MLTSLRQHSGQAPSDGGKKALATTLMDYARSSPDRIGGRLMPAIVYDPIAGRRAFANTLRDLRANRR
jgi:hypothetical protein